MSTLQNLACIGELSVMYWYLLAIHHFFAGHNIFCKYHSGFVSFAFFCSSFCSLVRCVPGTDFKFLVLNYEEHSYRGSGLSA